ncbi:hypothetical protein CO174_04370 [Candidatus Uhrbacteria bacterium CG_4_9_14_3_um_filter_50_9]|uniref:Uncharacterized protein n=1 Tax=Candidatus Uhrbacteria bacterium CG_4_9_14_3_um_filter_50_9 TaxID=1975035 RepID=A0A2M7XBL6_9BACT|nr:MAG: hypothetical protein CO174_04370 [Candidatus Uhrbacteria bacterium CG_4_9_14_3_um_filter_50_9]
MATNKRAKTVETPISESVAQPLESQAERERAPEGVEIPISPEFEGEDASEQQEETADQQEEQYVQSEPVLTPVVSSTPVVPAGDDRLEKEIESILQEDLTDLYLAMPPEKQQAFKEKGEETTGKIRKIVSSAKVNTKKVFNLIKDWLKLIPGVNKFFLEQEAKIKTDKILLVSEEEKKRGGTDFL